MKVEKTKTRERGREVGSTSPSDCVLSLTQEWVSWGLRFRFGVWVGGMLVWSRAFVRCIDAAA